MAERSLARLRSRVRISFSAPFHKRFRMAQGAARVSAPRVFVKWFFAVAVFSCGLAQLVERLTLTQDVAGSNPASTASFHGGVSSIGRVLDCDSKGQGFDPRTPPQFDVVPPTWGCPRGPRARPAKPLFRRFESGTPLHFLRAAKNSKHSWHLAKLVLVANAGLTPNLWCF